jgi:hypothetical protein
LIGGIFPAIFHPTAASHPNGVCQNPTMAQTCLTVLHSGFLNLTSVALGRLITDTSNPSQDFWPESVVPSLVANEIEERSFQDFRDVLEKSSNVDLRGKLTRLLSGDVGGQSTYSDQLSTSMSKIYSLQQPRSYFQRLCGDNETRAWMEGTLRDCPIFLVVGLVTVTAASVTRDIQKSKNVNGDASVPVLDIVTHGATTLVPGIGVALDVGAGVTVSHKTDSKTSFIAPGERVIGVQYRKVKFGLFSSHTVEKAFLENNSNRWQMFMGSDRSGSDDLLEADLEDSMEVDDLELEGEADVVAAENERLVFLDSES